MVAPSFDDRFEPLGLLAGVFLVLVGLGTLLGQPWTTKGSLVAVVVQFVGVVLMIALGAGLVWLVRSD